MAYIKLHKQNFYHNLNQFALKTGSVDKIAIVLKDNAYGHGVLEMAGMAKEFGITKAVVRNYDEAVVILELFDEIIALGGELITHDKISYAINSLEKLTSAPQGITIELKIDTGMHRNGIMPNELDEALNIIKNNHINLKGVMSHFASADELGSEYFYQYKNFQNAKKTVEAFGFKGVRYHIHNSAGALRFSKFDGDLMRLGIGAYGYSPMDAIFGDMNLKPVMSLFAKKVSTRELQKGQRVGYGGNYIADKNMVVSTYDIGYGDGWRRGNPHKPYTLPNGKQILGRVSMDFITLKGDESEVCIMNNANDAASQHQTISYEITCDLHANIKRVITKQPHLTTSL